jgi:type II secretory pathway component PulJ
MRRRSGWILVEALVAVTLGAVVIGAAVTLLQLQGRIARNLGERSERNDAIRSALLTLHAELQYLAPATDLRALARDSVAARIFRGVGVVCGRDRQNILLRYRGLRLPDPAKDSVLQIGVENITTINSVATDPGACAHTAREQVVSVNLNGEVLEGSLWLFFESGAYHLSTNALRYRRGAESRQPVTNEVLNDRLSGFASIADSLTSGIAITLRDRRTNASANAHLIFLNNQ